MADIISQSSAKNYSVVVTFRWGDDNAAYYTNWTDDITLGDRVYISTPTMEVKIPKIHGGSDEQEPFEIIMNPVSPLTELVKVSAYWPVSVEIGEIVPEDVSSLRILYDGTIWKAVKNPSGRTGLIQVLGYGTRVRLRVTLGMLAMSTCNNIFTDERCANSTNGARGIKPSAIVSSTGTITAITGKKITVTGANMTPILAAVDNWAGKRRYHLGWAEVDKMRLLIVKHQSDDTLLLKEFPPSTWLNAAVNLYAGCDKTWMNCHDKWDNLMNFNGFGIRMPAYHPQIDIR